MPQNIFLDIFLIKETFSAYKQTYQKLNKEKINERNRVNYFNRKKLKLKQYRESLTDVQKETQKAYQTKYRINNKEKLAEYQKQYHTINKVHN